MKNISTQISLQAIIDFLGAEVKQVLGDPLNVSFNYLRPSDGENSYTIDWISSSKLNKQEIAESSLSKVLLVDQDVTYSKSIQHQKKILIYVVNTRLAIAYITQKFFLPKAQVGIHLSATIDSSAIVSEDCYIGAGSVLGKCTIGKKAVIHPNVTIYDNVTIGENCIIHAGAVVGTEGLGCQRLADGTLIKFPHLGGVRIGNNVEIGANSQIARGGFSDTIIGNGVKINGLCFIAHNCVLEENVWITGNTMLAGSVKVGKNATIFSSVTIRDNRVIGNGAVIGMGAIVTKNVPAGETWVGNPARKIGE
jgi:UDP-3-O-[3-hydroxymyristoyl] glucosamine N-acyltransferase